MIILSIKDIVIDIAQRYGLNTWDWFAISLTLATFIVSLISLFVSCKTLKSQKKTEKNTTPVINKKIQLSLIEQLYSRVLRTYYYSIALNYQLEKLNYNIMPSHHFWDIIPVINDYLHESLYYDDIMKFSLFKEFEQECFSLISGLKHIKLVINSDKKSLKRQEMLHLYPSYERISDIFDKVLCICFNLDTQQKNEIYKRIFLEQANIARINYPAHITQSYIILNDIQDHSDILHIQTDINKTFLKNLIDDFCKKIATFTDINIIEFVNFQIAHVVLSTNYQNQPFIDIFDDYHQVNAKQDTYTMTKSQRKAYNKQIRQQEYKKRTKQFRNEFGNPYFLYYLLDFNK